MFNYIFNNASQMALYRKIPLKAVSRLWGRVNQLELPVWLRRPAIGLYIWMFKCDLSEATMRDLRAYHNLSEFFQRTLRPGVRPIDARAMLVRCAMALSTDQYC